MRFSIGAIFNNEAPYLKEWLDHYINRGAEHFYLINDKSDDNYIEVLEPYIKNNYITLFDILETRDHTREGRQSDAYNHFFLPIKNKSEWFLICDIDEYIWSTKNLKITDSLSLLEKNDIYYYEIPQILFGSNGYKIQPQNIVNSFTKRQIINEKYQKFIKKHFQFKPIFKSEKVNKFIVHWHFSSCEKMRPFFNDPNECLFRYNHYRLQSEEKWKINLNKKDVNNFIPKISTNFSPGLSQKITNKEKNYRTLSLFLEADKEQNIIEDFDLINQNIKNNL